ncbi:IS5/IS1182 family transposase [Actinoplanes friuliensis]|uniref:Transposase is4 family protein n=1 Tax=Actinoplanes friuliensis DSM 7358 TaxID=1246995 RepID=U5WAS2_9ACTN|nr:IS5/IS1182 family transposase [Actinoplanes friuliensis]AGZ46244.1 transposase is4 family protein [Actinoplanes friuliensis DSM 7358]
MLSYPATISLSSQSLNHLATLIRHHRRQLRSRWRRLNPARQALLALAHLRNGDTYHRLATGFSISTTTAWRYVREAIDLLACAAPDLTTAMTRIRRLCFVILDGTLIPIDRVADGKAYYSGKHRRHGMNIQVVADPAGRLIWASPALPGRAHDLTAARTHGLIDALTHAGVITFADRAYQGTQSPLITPYKKHKGRRVFTAWNKQFNRDHAAIRANGERANATLKQWKVLVQVRCSPGRTTAILQAIQVLHSIEAADHPR